MRFRYYLLSVVLLWAFIRCAGMKPNPQFTEPAAVPERESTPGSEASPGGEKNFERDLRQEIQNYMGVPYSWGGTTTAGMDCSGFVSVVFWNAVDLKLPHSARKIYKRGRWIPPESLRFGDLVFFENIESAGISHVGIYIGDQEFAHASTTRGVTISNLNEEYYKERYAGARRILNR